MRLHARAMQPNVAMVVPQQVLLTAKDGSAGAWDSCSSRSENAGSFGYAYRNGKPRASLRNGKP